MVFTCPKCESNEKTMELLLALIIQLFYNEKGENINPDKNFSTYNLQCGERLQLGKIID